jgi:hypothetical protein
MLQRVALNRNIAQRGDALTLLLEMAMQMELPL